MRWWQRLRSNRPCGRTVLITTRPPIFFELKGAEVFGPRQQRLDDSRTLPGLGSKRSAKGSSALRRHRPKNERDARWKGKNGREKDGNRSPVGTSQFSQPFMVPTDFFALFSRLIHTSPHEIRSSIPTCIIGEDIAERIILFRALLSVPVCVGSNRYACAGILSDSTVRFCLVNQP